MTGGGAPIVPWYVSGTAGRGGPGRRVSEPLRRPLVQPGTRAAVAAGPARQVAVRLLPLSDYAHHAQLGAVIAVHPTVADSVGVAWRTVLAVLLGSGLVVLLSVGGLGHSSIAITGDVHRHVTPDVSPQRDGRPRDRLRRVGVA